MKRLRVRLVIAGVAALSGIPAVTLASAPARADGALTLTPAASSIRMIPGSAYYDAQAAGAYGLRLGGVDTGRPVKFVVSAPPQEPGNKTFSVQSVAAGGTPRGGFSGGTWVSSQNVPASVDGAAGMVVTADPAGTEDYYLSSNTAGVFTVVLYQEGPTGDQSHYSAAEDPGAAVLTVTVWELRPVSSGATPNQDPADDASWGLSTTPAPIAPGQRATSRIELPPVDTVDIRGTIGNGDPRGVLGSALTGSGGLGGRVTLTYALGDQQRAAVPVEYAGLATGADGISRPAFTAPSPAMPAAGLLQARVNIPYSILTTQTAVGEPVTLTAARQYLLLGSKVYLSGTADPNTRVDFYATYALTPRDRVLIGSRVTNSDGTFQAGTTLHQTTAFIAAVNGKTAQVGVVSRTEIVRVSAQALGDGQVRWTINGRPSARGYANVYEYTPEDLDGRNRRIGHVSTDAYGDAVLVTHSAPGRQTFIIGFQVPGSSVGTRALTGTVR